MTQITAAQVGEQRERTGAGMMECKRALEETQRHRGGHRVAAQVRACQGGEARGRYRRGGSSSSRGSACGHGEVNPRPILSRVMTSARWKPWRGALKRAR
jgi:hypothetical protein